MQGPRAVCLTGELGEERGAYGAALELRESLASVRIGDEIARLGQSPFAGRVQPMVRVQVTRAFQKERRSGWRA